MLKSILLPILGTAATVLLPLAATTTAATLTLSGSVTGVAGDDNDEIDRWRSTSILKTFDLDGDNVYGTAGYVMFAIDNVGNTTAGTAPSNTNPFTFASETRRTVASIPSYLSFTTITSGSTGVASSYGYKQMDDPTLAPDATVANVESGAALRSTPVGTEASIFDLVIGADFPAGGIRLGMFYGNTDAYNGNFRLEQTVGGSTSLTVFQSVAIPLQMAFFDITDVAAGDTFRLFGFKDNPAVGNPNANFLIGGFTIDAIPEPASSTALLLGLGTLVARSRCRSGRDLPRV